MLRAAEFEQGGEAPPTGTELGADGGLLVAHEYGGFGGRETYAVVEEDRVPLPLAQGADRDVQGDGVGERVVRILGRIGERRLEGGDLHQLRAALALAVHVDDAALEDRQA